MRWIFCRTRYGSSRSLALIERWLRIMRDFGLRGLRGIGGREGAVSRCSTARLIWAAAETSRRFPNPSAMEIAKTRHPQRASSPRLLLRATIFAVRRQYSRAASKPRLRAVLHAQCDDARRHAPPRREGERLRSFAGSVPCFGEENRAARLFRHGAIIVTGGSSGRAGGGARKYIDSSISKTINCPPGISFADFKEVYRTAYEEGCKRPARPYRPNAVDGSRARGKKRRPARPTAPLPAATPLRIVESLRPLAAAPAPLANPAAAVALALRPIEGRAEKAGGRRLYDPAAGPAWAICWATPTRCAGPISTTPSTSRSTTSSRTDANARSRFFINSKNMEHYAWTVALTRMISAVFRRGRAM